MRTLIHECEYGTIEFRLPTIPETTAMMGELKELHEKKDELGSAIWVFNSIGKYIVKVNLTFENDLIDNYDKLMEYPEMMNELVAINNRILEKSLYTITGTAKKKR